MVEEYESFLGCGFTKMEIIGKEIYGLIKTPSRKLTRWHVIKAFLRPVLKLTKA
jgi:hypothetical protein